MRAVSCLTVAIVVFGCGRSAVDARGTTNPPADAGLDQGSGNAADAGGMPDAGPDGTSSPPPATIGATACPGNPPLLWSRTFSGEVDFRGAADENGNLYWVEYDPPPTVQNPDAPPWLVSADGEGKNRYRVRIPVASEEGAFLIAGGRALLSKGAVVAAYDAASGAPSWSLDLSGTYTGEYARVQGIADLGNGELAFALHDYGIASGLYLVDVQSGAIRWSRVASADANYRVQGSNGAGSAFGTSGNTSSYSSQQGYHTAEDVFVFDPSGQQSWSHRLTDAGSLLAWSSPGAAWLQIGGLQEPSPAADYTGVPSSWFSAVKGDDLGFAVFFGAAAATPIAVDAIRDGAVVASGPIAGTNSYDGVSTFPFLAGAKGDHLVLLSQNWHSIPALCHPLKAGTAALSRFDATSSHQCPFAFEGESAIEGAALLEGRVILGRRTYLTTACTHDVQPVTIEAYGLPGESLAPSGWVQRGGSPGMGMRPRHSPP